MRVFRFMESLSFALKPSIRVFGRVGNKVLALLSNKY